MLNAGGNADAAVVARRFDDGTRLMVLMAARSVNRGVHGYDLTSVRPRGSRLSTHSVQMAWWPRRSLMLTDPSTAPFVVIARTP